MSVEELVKRLRDYGLTIEPNIVICDRRVIDETADKLEELAAENREHVRRNTELNREISGVRRSYTDDKVKRIAAEGHAQKLRDALGKPIREQFYYPIEMPLNADGNGPASFEEGEVRKLTYEVWDRLFTTHASFDNLPDAIDKANELNAIRATKEAGE